MWTPTQESCATPHYFTISVWLTILTGCFTLWILQRLICFPGKRIESVKSREAASAPLIGAAECKPHQFDVFINHRGPDVKKTFVAHLNAALRRDGFRPFLDAKSIGQGRHVFDSIDRALKGACVHVAIFSKRYAESKYCLNELCDMLNSNHVILPVFYGVNPEDMRWINNGPFKKGFRKHVQRGRRDEIQKWKAALSKVADYRGFRLDEVNGDEEQLIRSILTEVRSAMPATLLPAKQQYGMEESVRNVLKMLDSVSVVGLVGMGGIGKTTLAMEIYNHFVSRGQFERYCFMRDVRSSEASELQRKLLRDLGRYSEVQSISPEDYKRAFDGLISQRVLVVVDDIDHGRQFAALVPDMQRLGRGSCIVITSRYSDVMQHAMAAAPSWKVYDVPVLSRSDSRRLFNHHAFLSETPSDEGFAELAAEVADACGGHALSLEVIGASLFDKRGCKDREIWMEAVKSLQESAEIFDKLRSSYDSLPTDGDRAMFCDIACMLIGMKKEVALTIWKSCEHSNGADCCTSKAPGLVLRRLMDRSLVRVDGEGRLTMHDVLRDMGRDIVKRQARGSKKQTHLWDAATALKVLSFKKTNTSIRGIRLAIREITRHGTWQYMEDRAVFASMADRAVSCEVSQLASMEELHLLILDGCRVVVPDGFSSWPQELRWLQWRYCCFSTLPSHLQLPCLVVLDLSCSDKLTHLWENDAHIQLPLLHTLDLTNCRELEELPENVGQCVPKLKRLVMSWCNSVRRLPESIGHLTDLEHLLLTFCSDLRTLPDSVVGLVSLRILVVRCCLNLQQLPEELGTLTNLETLDVSSCRTLSELPASIGGLWMLKTLEVEDTNVRDLPAEVGLLSSLTSLAIPGLRSVPETLHGLQSLTLLRAGYGSADMGDLGALAALKELDLSYHAAITTLPQTIGNLKWLVRLVMVRCPELSTVEALPKSLEHLDLSDCRKLTRIPSLATMSCLLHLDLENCRSLRHVHGLECFTALEDIDVSGCTCIEDCRLHRTKNNALRKCDVKGSKVSVAYNNRWLEREPALQVISYLGDAVPVLPNGMANQLVMPPDWTWTLVLRTSIRSKAECVAVVWCVATSFPKKYFGSSGFCIQVIVQVWRAGRLVLESRKCLAVKGSSDSRQVYLGTMRRGHLAVQSLQLGDQICFLMRVYNTCTVVEGAVCVVYSEDENLALMVNSEALSQSESQDLALQFGQLVLEDKDEQVNSGLS